MLRALRTRSLGEMPCAQPAHFVPKHLQGGVGGKGAENTEAGERQGEINKWKMEEGEKEGGNEKRETAKK